MCFPRGSFAYKDVNSLIVKSALILPGHAFHDHAIINFLIEPKAMIQSALFCSRLMILLSLVIVPNAVAAKKPNIVWIVSEDNSIHYLKHFFKGGAKAPNIEALATHGLTFDHAFSNSPVCSVARTTLATGCYGPRIGTQFHRAYKRAEMPEGLRMFPAYLREAGYYTTNNSKKDYAAIEGEGVWDESSRTASWSKRPDKAQPFFHMESHGQSHEGSLHFNKAVFENEKTITDPASVKLAPYHPDVPIFRYTHARYLDRMGVIDEIVGRTVAKLKEEGLLEDTFIFYFGDHGGVLPRGKGYIYESGLHVPLVVRVPENFKHLVDGKMGSRVKGFVNFIDFGPTSLHLAGVGVPEQVDGKAFLGEGVSLKDVNARDESFGHADRFDEKSDLIRSLRKGRFQYIRNYQPHLPDGLNNNYRYKSLAYQKWRELFKAGKLEGATRQFYEPKQVEHLYDCESDPHQVKNLASDPKFAKTLADLRQRLHERVGDLPDLSFYPESHLVGHALDNAVEFGQKHKKEIGGLLDIADLQLHSFAEAEPKLREALASRNAMIRYWAAMVCTAFGKQAAPLTDVAVPLLKDNSPTVRIRAAEFLGSIGKINPQPILTEIVNTTGDGVVAVEALNAVVWFRDFFGDRYPVKRSDFKPISQLGDLSDRLNYIAGVPYPPKKGKKRAAAGKSKTLKFDFEKEGALSAWFPTQTDRWVIADTKSDRGKALHLLGASRKYQPPFRSPLSINLLKEKVFGDFVLTAKVKTLQTSRGHRDMCIFWGWQDPAHFYYVHLGEKVDPNSSQVFIVKEAPRTPITTVNVGGIPWKDDTWHDVKLVRKVKDGTVEVYFDDMDKPVKTAKDKTFQWGMIGLGSFDDLGMWDDVRIDGELIDGKSPVLPKHAVVLKK